MATYPPRQTRSRSAARSSTSAITPQRASNILQPASKRAKRNQTPTRLSSSTSDNYVVNASPSPSPPRPSVLASPNGDLRSHPKPRLPPSPAKRPKLSPLSESVSFPSLSQSHRPLIARAARLSLHLYSFLPESLIAALAENQHYENQQHDDDSEVPHAISARIDSRGYGIAVIDDRIIVWRLTDTAHSVTETVIALNNKPSDVTVAINRIVLLTNSNGAMTMLYVSDDSEVMCHRQGLTTVLVTLSLTRDDSVLSLVSITPTIHAIGTNNGRIIALYADTDSGRASVADVSKHRAGMIGSLVSVGSRMLRWSSSQAQSYQQSSSPVITMIPYHCSDGDDYGVLVLQGDGLISQWRVMGNERALLWSSPFARLVNHSDIDSSSVITMTSAGSKLFVLYSVDDRTRVAVLTVVADSTPPISVTDTVVSVSAVDSEDITDIAVTHNSAHDGLCLFAYSESHVTVTTIADSDDNVSASAYTFRSSHIVSGGVIGAYNEEFSPLPTHRNAKFVLVNDSVGVIAVTHNNVADTDTVIASLSSVRLDTADSPLSLLQTSLYFYCQHQYTSAKYQLQRCNDSGTLDTTRASPILDNTVLSLAQSIIDSRITGAIDLAEPSQSENSLNAKFTNYEMLLNYLQYYQLWSLLTSTAQNQLVMYGEYLSIALNLFTSLASNHRALTKATTEQRAAKSKSEIFYSTIELLVKNRAKSAKVKLTQTNVLTFFFSHLSVLSNIFDVLVSVTNKYFAELLDYERHRHALIIKNEKEIENYYFQLQALLGVADTLLAASAKYRETHRGALVVTNSRSSAPRWTINDSARASMTLLSTVTINDLSLLTDCSKDVPRLELFASTLRFSRLFLSEYSDHIRVHPHDDAIIDEFSSVRSSMVSALHRLLPSDLGSRKEIILDFAAEFHDYRALLTFILTDAHSSSDSHSDNEGCRAEQLRVLANYMNEFGDLFIKEFQSFALERGQPALLFQIQRYSPPPRYRPLLQSFLNDRQSLKWVDEIDTEDYSGASDTLLGFAKSLAGNDRATWSQQKNLLSLSKLSALCADNASNSDRLIALNDKLDMCVAQAYAAQGDSEAPILEPQTLMDQLLTIASSPTDSDSDGALVSVSEEALNDLTPLILAIEVYHRELFPLGVTTSEADQQKLSALTAIWSAVFRSDYPLLKDWIDSQQSVGDAKLESTKLYVVWRHLSAVDYYDRRPEFEASYRFFVHHNKWNDSDGDDGQTLDDSEEFQRAMREVLKLIQQRATDAGASGD